MLLHDICIPESYVEDVNGKTYFSEHSTKSSEEAKEILLRLKYDNDTVKAVTELILYHDIEINPDKKDIKRLLKRIEKERFLQLIEVERANTIAEQGCSIDVKLMVVEEKVALLNDIVEQKQCYSLKDLAIGGKDLIAIGISEGAKIGEILQNLLDMVIEEAVENEKNALLKAIKNLVV
jgi:tRNA nucleotidyltransferase (CCA-adding enzyme)